MSGLNNLFYLGLLIVSNVFALLVLWVSIKRPPVARVLLFMLFAWACYTNWTTSRNQPSVYLEYGELAWVPFYRNFINGFFADYIKSVVGTIAICQGLIAVAMLRKGTMFRLGCIGAIIFLLAISPLGVGAGFPCTLTLALAIFYLIRKPRPRTVSTTNKFIHGEKVA